MLQILLEYASSHVRLALRVYFNIALPFLGIVGDQCCKKRSQLQLLRGSTLDVTQTTGWLRGANAAYILYAMRRSPAGWLGILMVLSSILWFAADLLVSGFVVPVTVAGRCAFNTTSYVVVGHKGKIGPFVPNNIGTPWNIINQATITSRNNGGLTGIFHKVNTDPNFCADETDIIGRWQCNPYGQDSYYIPREDPDQLVQDLTDRDLLYQYSTARSTSFIGNNWYVQLGAWSSSVDDWHDELAGESTDEIINSPILKQWDVRASIEVSPNPEDTKVMRSFQCTMDTTALDYVRGKVQAWSTLDTFVNNMRTNVYQYFTGNVTISNDPGVAIATTLDSIMMMAAAYNAGFNDPPPTIPDPYQGCLTTKTKIPIEVIVIWLVISLCTVSVCIYWLALAIRIRHVKQNSPHSSKLVAKLTPNGLLGWMRQAVRLKSAQLDIKDRELKTWALLPSHDRQSLHLVHRDADSTASSVSAAGYTEVQPEHRAASISTSANMEKLQIMKHAVVADAAEGTAVDPLSDFGENLGVRRAIPRRPLAADSCRPLLSDGNT